MGITVALTGASGFIGQAIAQRLAQAGLTVRGLVRNSKKVPGLEHQNISLISGTLENKDSLYQLIQGCTGLVNCAGAIRGSKKKDFVASNVQGVTNLLSVCLAQPSPPRIVHLSSLAAREPSLSPYAWSKKEGELAFERDGKSLNWIILRPPAVYGPGDKALLPLFTLGKKGIGLQLGPSGARFSLLHVHDLTDAILRGLEAETLCSKTFEIDDGCPNGYSWESVFRILNPRMKRHVTIPKRLLEFIGTSNELLSRLFGYSPLFTTGKVRELVHTDWVCASVEAHRELQWNPKIPLEEGLRHLFASDSLILSKKN